LEYLGTITASTAKDQSNTAVPFTIEPNSRILIQPADGACYISLNKVAATAVTSANGLALDASEKLELSTGSRLTYLSCLPFSGTVNVKVFRLYVNP
jgi:hypothetical protein